MRQWFETGLAEWPVSSTRSSQACWVQKCQAHRDTVQSSLLPWSACCVQCFSGAFLVVQTFSVRRSLGEQEQALGLEMVGQSLHPTCQSRCAQTEIDRDRERETDRDRGTEGQRQRQAGDGSPPNPGLGGLPCSLLKKRLVKRGSQKRSLFEKGPRDGMLHWLLWRN